MAVTVKIKQAVGDTFEVSINLSDTVLHLKQQIEQRRLLPVSQQRLIYKGQILEDDCTIEHYEVADGHVIHLVRGSSPPQPPPSSSPTVATVTPFPVPINPSMASAAGASPFAPFMGMRPTGGNNMNGGNNQLLMNLFNMPGISSMLSNPEVMRELMMANPTTRQIMERNPEIAHALQDPRTLRQAMEMMRNPALMQEMTRNTDRALSNLDTMPGGMDALARLYNEVQRPLEEAREESLSTSSNPLASIFGGTAESSSSETQPQRRPPPGPFDPQPLPNPWQRQHPPSFGGLGRMGAGGGTSRTGSNSLLGDPMGLDSMGDMYSNPIIRQMTMQLMNNPDFMQQALQSMGGAGPHSSVPGVTPPSAAQATSQRDSWTAGMGLNNFNTFPFGFMQRPLGGTVPTPGTGTTTAAANANANPATASDTSGTSAPSNDSPASASPTTASGQAGFTAASANPMLGMMNPFLASLMPGVSPAPPPQQLFATQLQQLRDMGFDDEAAMLRALQATGGNVALALERLLGTQL